MNNQTQIGIVVVLIMGNSFGSKKTTKVMKIDGESFKLKTPVKAGDVLKDHPGLVLLESEAVKHYGTRAKPLEVHEELEPKRLYFLVELPKEKVPRRVRSSINMSAKDRLESLVLSRRSVSDLTIMKAKQSEMQGGGGGGSVVVQGGEGSQSGGAVRLKLRLPKAEVEKLIKSSTNEAEAAERIMSLCMANNGSKWESVKNGDMMKVLSRGRVGECKKPHQVRMLYIDTIYQVRLWMCLPFIYKNYFCNPSRQLFSRIDFAFKIICIRVSIKAFCIEI